LDGDIRFGNVHDCVRVVPLAFDATEGRFARIGLCEHALVPTKLIALRFPAACVKCKKDLPPKTRAWWDSVLRTTTCTDCNSDDNARESPSEHAGDIPAATSRYAFGVAGGSAQREYEKRHQRREMRIDQKWGRLAGVIKFLSDDPQNITAWARGSDGERRLAARLTRDVGDRAIVLNDRKVPKTRGNIDHIVIAASGVWVIDAKNYKGAVERRDVGGWFNVENRLYVNRRDQSKLVRGLGWQITAVRAALSDTAIPVTGVLCFTDAEWGFFAKPFTIDGVKVTWAKSLVEMITEAGPLKSADVSRVAERLSVALPPEIQESIPHPSN
jgi:hypothetical protein